MGCTIVLREKDPFTDYILMIVQKAVYCMKTKV